jgi:putative iron-regulated protein
LDARVPYLQSEVFRFGNRIVDEWEGQLNTWPLDEGLIDYVNKTGYHHEMGNAGATANIVANTSITVGGKKIDLSKLTPEVLVSLNEIGGSEANVATGYHAIEFLLWGQDLNGTKSGAGKRPYTDYVVGKNCTHEHCDRRGEYLKAATQLLVDDLVYMQGQWSKDKKDNYRARLNAEAPASGLTKALFGMGSLALGELAGERMKVALTANSTEDEQDCFSDNTHNAHFYDAKGIENIYFGHYVRVDGSTLTGPSIADLVENKDPQLADVTRKQFGKTMLVLQAMVDAAEDGTHPMKFDQMIAEGNIKGAALIEDSISSLVELTRQIEKVAYSIGIENLNPDTADHDF